MYGNEGIREVETGYKEINLKIAKIEKNWGIPGLKWKNEPSNFYKVKKINPEGFEKILLKYPREKNESK